MKDKFYQAIDSECSAYDDDATVYGIGSAAEECVEVFKNELRGILLALHGTQHTQESKDTFIQEIKAKYEL